MIIYDERTAAAQIEKLELKIERLQELRTLGQNNFRELLKRTIREHHKRSAAERELDQALDTIERQARELRIARGQECSEGCPTD